MLVGVVLAHVVRVERQAARAVVINLRHCWPVQSAAYARSQAAAAAAATTYQIGRGAPIVDARIGGAHVGTSAARNAAHQIA